MRSTDSEMENRAHALAAGLFTVVLGLAAVLAFWWLGQQGTDIDTYVIETPRNVSGLNVQAQVRYRGIRAGKVTAIELDPRDPRLILVRIGIDSRYRLTRGTTAELGYQGITGLAHVLLEDDGSDTVPLPGAAGEPPRLVMKPTFLDGLDDKAGDIVAQAGDVVRRLNRLLDDKNVHHVARTLENAAVASESLRELPATVAALRQALSDENLRRLRGSLVQAEKASGEVAPLAAEAREAVRAVTALAGRLDRLAAEGGGRVTESTLPQADALLRELTDNSRRLSRLLELLERTPQALVFGGGQPPAGPGEPGFSPPKP